MSFVRPIRRANVPLFAAVFAAETLELSFSFVLPRLREAAPAFSGGVRGRPAGREEAKPTRLGARFEFTAARCSLSHFHRTCGCQERRGRPSCWAQLAPCKTKSGTGC